MLRSFSSPLALLALLLLAGCGFPSPEPADQGDQPAAAPRAEAPAITPPAPEDAAIKSLEALVPPSCEVPGAGEVLVMTATSRGLVLGFAAPADEGAGLTLRRFAAEGCVLAPDGSAPVAASGLLDADDLGNLYVYPRETAAPGVVSTMLPGEYEDSMVARVEAGGKVTRLLRAGRGIWGFGVSPGGGSLWVTACGPTGIFSMTGAALAPVLSPPGTLWEQEPSVLTDDHTFWSTGYRTCAPDAPLGPDCGFSLVRTTPEGSREVGTTIVDAGAGFAEASLRRCGGRVCGQLPDAVIVWDEEGQIRQTIRPADLAARPSEQIAQVSGNQRGVYVLLHGEEGTRLVFVPVS